MLVRTSIGPQSMRRQLYGNLKRSYKDYIYDRLLKLT